MLEVIYNSAIKDSEYTRLKEVIETNVALPVTLQMYKSSLDQLSIAEDLIVYNGKRVLVPYACRKKILSQLHLSHQGFDKTYKLARELYFWPGMNSDLKNIISNCHPCQEMRPSLPKECTETETHAKLPMEQLGLDLFDWAGKSYLVCVDRFSGYPFVFKMNNTRTTSVTAKLQEIFNNFGYAKRIRTDNGRQFASQEFKDYCKSKGSLD